MSLHIQRAFRGYRGTHVTCFTSTKVQILTRSLLWRSASSGRVRYRIHLHLRKIDVFCVAITPIQAMGRGHIIRQRMRDEAARLADLEAKRLAASLQVL
jgi:hypothetical protein